MIGRNWLIGFACAFGVVCGGTPAGAETQLRLLSAWNPNNPAVPRVETVFINNVLQASKGEVKIVRSGPEVVPTFEQFQPVSAGVFDLLYQNMSYHQATTGVGSLFEATKSDSEERRAKGAFKWADDYYRKNHGITLIAVMPQLGFQYLLKEPVTAEGLKGSKIRTIPVMEGVTKSLAGIPVNMPPQEIYQGIQKGVIDGTVLPVGVVAGFKVQEVVKYVARPIVGQSNMALLMNAKKFDSLPAGVRQMLLEEGRKIEKFAYKVSFDLEGEDKVELDKAGIRITEFSPAHAAKLAISFGEAVRATASRSTPAAVEEFYTFLKGAGLLAN
jgi:TRAP-type C4-dicarboxylate transport system substrate-binding protein